jgi:hypothetical protein
MLYKSFLFSSRVVTAGCGAELRREQCAFVQESVGFVASSSESVEGVGLLAELRGPGAVAINAA